MTPEELERRLAGADFAADSRVKAALRARLLAARPRRAGLVWACAALIPLSVVLFWRPAAKAPVVVSRSSAPNPCFRPVGSGLPFRSLGPERPFGALPPARLFVRPNVVRFP